MNTSHQPPASHQAETRHEDAPMTCDCFYFVVVVFHLKPSLVFSQQTTNIDHHETPRGFVPPPPPPPLLLRERQRQRRGILHEVLDLRERPASCIESLSPVKEPILPLLFTRCAPPTLLLLEDEIRIEHSGFGMNNDWLC